MEVWTNQAWVKPLLTYEYRDGQLQSPYSTVLEHPSGEDVEVEVISSTINQSSHDVTGQGNIIPLEII